MTRDRHLGISTNYPLERIQRGHIRLFPRLYGNSPDNYTEGSSLDTRHRDRIESRLRGSYPRRNFDPRSRIMSGFLEPIDTLAATSSENALPFCRAINRLQEQLVRAMDFFTRFQYEYNTDISTIKNYATEDILDELWILKVKGQNDSTHGENPGISEPLESGVTFEEIMRDLVLAVKHTLRSTTKVEANGSRNVSARIHSEKRMKGKIHTANEQILELLNLVMTKDEHCSALVSELKLLNALIDSSSEGHNSLETPRARRRGKLGVGQVEEPYLSRAYEGEIRTSSS